MSASRARGRAAGWRREVCTYGGAGGRWEDRCGRRKTQNTRRQKRQARAGERRGEARRCNRGDARHTTRGHTHGQDAGGWRLQGRRSRAGHDTINSGTKADAIRSFTGAYNMITDGKGRAPKADDRGQGMTRLITAPRPTRFDLKNGSRRTETSTLDLRGPRYDTEL